MTKGLFNWRRFGSWSSLIIFLAVITISFYSWSRTRDLIRGPRLQVTTPVSEFSNVGQPLVKISGQIERVAHLRLNEGKIFADSSGHFSEELLLYPGYNIIKLEATDRFGRRLVRFLKLNYQDKKT